MPRFYEKAIYLELGEDIGNELKENDCKIIINYDNLTYTFSDCPDSILKKILSAKKSKGERSLLNEFKPYWHYLIPFSFRNSTKVAGWSVCKPVKPLAIA